MGIESPRYRSIASATCRQAFLADRSSRLMETRCSPIPSIVEIQPPTARVAVSVKAPDRIVNLSIWNVLGTISTKYDKLIREWLVFDRFTGRDVLNCSAAHIRLQFQDAS